MNLFSGLKGEGLGNQAELYCPFCKTWTDIGPEYNDKSEQRWNCGFCGKGPEQWAPFEHYPVALEAWNTWVLEERGVK